MSKSILYAANTAAQSVPVGGTVNFGSAVRRYGCDCRLSGGNVVIMNRGYYDVDVNLTVTTAVAGSLTASIYLDGVLIPGATVTKTVTVGGVTALSIPAVVREKCCCESAVTVIITGTAATVNNAAIRVVKD
jgi:hypothetical protein